MNDELCLLMKQIVNVTKPIIGKTQPKNVKADIPCHFILKLTSIVAVVQNSHKKPNIAIHFRG